VINFTSGKLFGLDDMEAERNIAIGIEWEDWNTIIPIAHGTYFHNIPIISDIIILYLFEI
jgi:hypothetical protein